MNLEKFLKMTLAFQLLLLIVLTYPTKSSKSDISSLTELKKQNISKIILNENDKTLELTKQSDIWFLKDKFNFPANQDKVARILDSIFTNQKLQKVGQSNNALVKYKLADKNYQEKITVYDNTKEESFLFGDTPEFKKIYIRNQKSNDSYVINLSKFDLGVDINSWYQKNFLGFKKELIKKISFDSFSISKEKDKEKNIDKFIVNNLEEKQDDEKVDFLINKLISLSFKDILSSDKINLPSPDFKIEVLKEDGSNVTLSFKKINDKFILKVSNMPFDFEVSKNMFNDFKEAKKSDLVVK